MGGFDSICSANSVTDYLCRAFLPAQHGDTPELARDAESPAADAHAKFDAATFGPGGALPRASAPASSSVVRTAEKVVLGASGKGIPALGLKAVPANANAIAATFEEAITAGATSLQKSGLSRLAPKAGGTLLTNTLKAGAATTIGATMSLPAAALLAVEIVLGELGSHCNEGDAGNCDPHFNDAEHDSGQPGKTLVPLTPPNTAPNDPPGPNGDNGHTAQYGFIVSRQPHEVDAFAPRAQAQSGSDGPARAASSTASSSAKDSGPDLQDPDTWLAPSNNAGKRPAGPPDGRPLIVIPTSSAFSSVNQAPPALFSSLSSEYVGDPNAVANLGVGVQRDALGNPVLPRAVRAMEINIGSDPSPRPPQPPRGNARYLELTAERIFGEPLAKELQASGRLASGQTLGATEALSRGAWLIKNHLGQNVIYVDDPTYANHPPVLEGHGLKVAKLPYLDLASGKLQLDEYRDRLKALPEGSVVLMHAAGHNPGALDRSKEQLKELIPILQERNITVFVDFAYAGFVNGLEEDAYLIRLLVLNGINVMVASSDSKTFGLYGDRGGALMIVTNDGKERNAVQSQIDLGASTFINTPPSTVARVVSGVLADPQLRKDLIVELGEMRQQCLETRTVLATTVAEMAGQPEVTRKISPVVDQVGMFGLVNVGPSGWAALKNEGVYTVPVGADPEGNDIVRVNISAAQQKLTQVAEIFTKVMKKP